MFGHRGIWRAGWKAVAFHPPGTPYETDRWELFHLDEDFSETNDLASREPAKLAAMVQLWWEEAEKHKSIASGRPFRSTLHRKCQPVHGGRRRYVFHAGMGHVPTEVAPDVRARSYLIEALARVDHGSEGVLIAHGDATTGYSLYLRGGHLVHDMNVGGEHVVVRSDRVVPPGERRLGVRVRRLSREVRPTIATGPGDE